MRRRLPILLAAMPLVVPPCVARAGAPPAPAPAGLPAEPWALRPADFDPLGFLGALQARRDVPGGVRVGWPPPGWVKAEHVPALLALVRSAEPVAAVCGFMSAHVPPPGSRSTLGQEALRLIEGYRRGGFSQGCSDLVRPGDPGEAERWWAGNSRR